MNKKEAIHALSDGHSVWKVAYAKKICKTLGVKFSEGLAQEYRSTMSANNPKGLRMKDGQEGTLGVYSLELSGYVADQLGVRDKAQECIGRGFQAQAYADEISKAVSN